MSLQGTFKTLGITEVLEFLSSRTASGRLDVTTEMGTASYILSDGAVAAAEYSFIRESGVDAAEATYYVVSELDGSFYFDDDIVGPDDVTSLDGEPEDVGSVLFRTADIAERWADVEEVIPSPNHLLTRNTELDGSVTIQPEWWKALEMIGEGSTSLQLASTLELSALEASLTALAMTNAGLLLVTEMDPLNIALSAELDEAVEDHAPVEQMPPAVIDAPEPVADVLQQAPSVDAPQPVFEAAEPAPDLAQPVFEAAEPVPDFAQPVFEAAEPAPDLAQPAFDAGAPAFDDAADSPVFEPVDMLEMVDVEPPTPEVLVAPPEIPAEPTMSFSTPAPDEAPTVDADPSAPTQIEQAPVLGASGMDDLSALEYMVEPEGSAPVVPADEDDGWSNAHTPDLSPMAASPAPIAPAPLVAEPAPVAPSPAPEMALPQQPTPVTEPSPFDGLPVPQQVSPFDGSAPVPDVPPAMDVSSLPSPPPPIGDDHRPAAPVPDVAGYAQPAAAPESMATSMAGEVLDDLASMADELNEPIETGEEWQLDGTFVPEANPTPPAAVGDPFGDLGDLLDNDDERSSVLKFLRRD